MTISAIVAIANDRCIGKNNDIPWYLPADLKYFKKKTLNHHIIMGRKCYESIGRPLPKRTNVIVTRNPFYIISNCLVVNSIEDALRIAQENGEEEAMIIGGGQIYEQALPYCDRLYITEVDVDVEEGNIFFPEIDMEQWDLVSEEAHQKDEKNVHDYVFKIYERKNK